MSQQFQQNDVGTTEWWFNKHPPGKEIHSETSQLPLTWFYDESLATLLTPSCDRIENDSGHEILTNLRMSARFENFGRVNLTVDEFKREWSARGFGTDLGARIILPKNHTKTCWYFRFKPNNHPERVRGYGKIKIRGRKVGTKEWTLYESQLDAATKLGLHDANISKCVKKERADTGGFEFEKVDNSTYTAYDMFSTRD